MQTMEKATQASPAAPAGHRRDGRRTHFPWPAWGFWVALAWLLTAPLGHGAGTNYLSWKDSRVSADIQSWDLSQVLERITAETRWQVYVDPEAHLEPLMLAREVAQMLGVSLSWVYRATRNGEVPAFRIGSRLRFRRSDVDSYLERHRKEGRRP